MFEIPANYSQGNLAVGGKLFGSTDRLVFVPNRIDACLGGRVLSIPKTQIFDVKPVPRSLSFTGLFSGSLVPRMSVTLHDGTQHRFVVNSINRSIELMLAYLSSEDPLTSGYK